MVAELGVHPAEVAVPVGVGVGEIDADADGELVGEDTGGAPVATGDGVGVGGMRKHPLRISVAPLAITAKSAMGTSRFDMPQS
jgi:hypothetical protein